MCLLSNMTREVIKLKKLRSRSQKCLAYAERTQAHIFLLILSDQGDKNSRVERHMYFE